MENESYKSFTDVILSPTPTILGLKLHPYSLGHQIHLKNAKSCFVGDNFFKLKDSKILVELVIALLICSTDYDTFRGEFERGELPKMVSEYVPTVRKTLRNNGKNKTKEQMAEAIANEVEIFIRYINQGTTTQAFDKIKQHDSEFKPNPIDFEQSMKDSLMTECNLTRDEALNLPMTETLSAYLLLGHKRGIIEIDSKPVWELKHNSELLKGLLCPV